MSEHPIHGMPPGESAYVLRLFVSGATLRSTRAIVNIKRICETELAGRYALEVIDIYQQPELAKRVAVVAVPTLIRLLPAPIRRQVGDLSETEKVLVGLDLRPDTSRNSKPEEPTGA